MKFILLTSIILFGCSNNNTRENDPSEQNQNPDETVPLQARVTFCSGAPGGDCVESTLFDYLEGAYARVTFNRSVSADEFGCKLSVLNNVDYSVKKTTAVELELNDTRTEGIYILKPEATAIVLCIEGSEGETIACDTASFFIEGDPL